MSTPGRGSHIRCYGHRLNRLLIIYYRTVAGYLISSRRIPSLGHWRGSCVVAATASNGRRVGLLAWVVGDHDFGVDVVLPRLSAAVSLGCGRRYDDVLWNGDALAGETAEEIGRRRSRLTSAASCDYISIRLNRSTKSRPQ